MDSNPPQEHRRFAPATQRNREAILGVLKTALPASGLVLEVASGTGEHAMFFARELPGLTWQPSDPDPQARASIAAWRKAAGPANLLEPLALDASASDWPIAGAQAMVCINMLHISAWAAGEGLMLGAGRLLSRGAPLMIYGPFRREGLELEPSNAAFDEDLRARNPAWGLRLVHEVATCASSEGLMLEQVLQMPANNLALVFRKI